MIRFSKISFYIILCASLSSCAIIEFPFNQIGFKLKNPIYNDNNASNYKYNKETFLGAIDRRMPAENDKYIAISNNSNIDNIDTYNSNPSMSKFESNYGIKKNNFWKNVYSTPPSDKKPESEIIKDDAKYDNSLNSNQEYQKPNISTSGSEMNYNESDEKILKSIEFIDNKQ